MNINPALSWMNTKQEKQREKKGRGRRRADKEKKGRHGGLPLRDDDAPPVFAHFIA